MVSDMTRDPLMMNNEAGHKMDNQARAGIVIRRGVGMAACMSAVILFGLSACSNEPVTKIAETQPKWARYNWLGMHPLMSVADAEKALAERDFAPTKCNADDPVPEAGAIWISGEACFLSSETGVEIALATVQWKGTSHISDIHYYSPASMQEQNDEEAVKMRAEVFTKIYGPPDAVNENGAMTSYVWRVPGGSESLPDTIVVRRGKWQAPEAVMTSHWIHKQKAAEDAVANKGEVKQ